jgi:hypothetical protein
VFQTGNPGVTTYVVDYNPQGQETSEFIWNASTTTPMSAWYLDPSGSGGWTSETINYSSTMAAQYEVLNLVGGDWRQTAWSSSAAGGLTSQTAQFQAGTGRVEWQSLDYAPGNSEDIEYNLSGNGKPTAWSSMIFQLDDTKFVTSEDTVYNNGNQSFVYYNASDPGYAYSLYYQGSKLSRRTFRTRTAARS